MLKIKGRRNNYRYISMIKRSLYPLLVKHLPAKEITLIIGPRQSGKTTLMLWLKAELEQKGEPTVFLNFDVEWDRPHLASQAALIRKLELELGKKSGFVFIDEIQRKEDAGLFLKGLYDLKLPYKFIVSGSGSLELKERIHESLVGRKQLFELTTLTFEEFVDFKTGYKYSKICQPSSTSRGGRLITCSWNISTLGGIRGLFWKRGRMKRFGSSTRFIGVSSNGTWPIS